MEHFSQRDKILTLVGILLALFLGALDQTIVATALPRIVADLHGLDRFAWVATAYLIASTALVPIYGKLADSYSRKKIQLTAVLIFLFGSFMCGLSGEFKHLPLIGDGMNQLILFRAIQGFGGAGLFAMAFIIIADLFPPRERGKYQGFVGATFGFASVLGPYLGGLLTDHFTGVIGNIEGWRWVFYVNIPFGALALWFIVRRMPPLPPKSEHQRLDYFSAALLLVGLIPLITALQLEKTKYPWDGVVVLSMLGVSIAALIIFVIRSLHAASPILDLSLFKNRIFRMSNLALFLLGGAFFSVVIFLPLFMVNVVGVSATKAGISLIPLSVGLFLGSTGAGQLVTKFGHYKRWMLIGGAILAVGIFLLSRMTSDVQYWHVTVYMLICGLGIGPSMPLYTLAIQNAVPLNRIGQATSSSQFFRQIGGAIGAAVMGTILTTVLTTYFMTHMPPNMQGHGPNATFNQEHAMASGGESVGENIQESFEANYLLLQKAVENHDTAALSALKHNPFISDKLKVGLSMGTIPVQALPKIKERMMQRSQEVTKMVQSTIKEAFTHAVTQIYTFTIFIVIAGWLVTWLIPEIPLRKTLSDLPPVME